MTKPGKKIVKHHMALAGMVAGVIAK
jgi:hypothetical protein